MNVAVVGAGIFGVTIANRISRLCNITLFEQNDKILSSTSSKNQFRVHRGYHYPRSILTAQSSKRSEPKFVKEYKEAIVFGKKHYYAIAKTDSLTTRDEYINFCEKLELEYEEVDLSLLNNSMMDLVVRVNENLFDPEILKRICEERLEKNKINIKLNTKFRKEDAKKFDYVIYCTYSSLNSLVPDPKEYQYELCEKPVIQLPSEFKDKSIVILDGPFMCIDPFGKNSGMHVMGNVVHAIHSTNIGLSPEVPDEYFSLLNKGIINNPPTTNWVKFIESGSKFIPQLSEAKHVGSMYTIRTVLPYKEKTDARPTIVSTTEEKIISVFSGKVSSCIEAAEEVEQIISASF